MTAPRYSRPAGLAGALVLVLAPVATELAAAETVCPDAATVQAARLVEFQTMMMGVAVRCRHVGVPIADHLDGMTTARRTMFTSANDRVAAYLRSLNTRPAPGAAPPAMTASTPAAEVQAKPAAGKPAPGKLAAAKAAPGKRPLASPAAMAGATVTKPRKAALGTAAAAATPAAPAKPATKVSRRTDPYDRYLTMIGNQYGAGMTTLQRCKAFDAIVLSLGDKTNTDRLLTMVSSSLVQATLLEAIVNCPAGKK
ncbi:MAG: hypothetical protein KGQ75_10830 [Sphingomonadales bacterium]|nr:hypothetical protein [Sphingomonadales bacterium]